MARIRARRQSPRAKRASAPQARGRCRTAEHHRLAERSEKQAPQATNFRARQRACEIKTPDAKSERSETRLRAQRAFPFEQGEDSHCGENTNVRGSIKRTSRGILLSKQSASVIAPIESPTGDRQR